MARFYDDGHANYSRHNAFYYAFIKRIALRLSCYECSFKGVNRLGDLTLADFWGVLKTYPQYDEDDKGTSLVLVNNLKGHKWLANCGSKLFLGKADMDTAIAGNPMLVRSAFKPSQRNTFYDDLDILSFERVIRKYQLCCPSFYRRASSRLKHKLKRVFQCATCLKIKK